MSSASLAAGVGYQDDLLALAGFGGFEHHDDLF